MKKKIQFPSSSNQTDPKLSRCASSPLIFLSVLAPELIWPLLLPFEKEHSLLFPSSSFFFFFLFFIHSLASFTSPLIHSSPIPHFTHIMLSALKFAKSIPAASALRSVQQRAYAAAATGEVKNQIRNPPREGANLLGLV